MEDRSAFKLFFSPANRKGLGLVWARDDVHRSTAVKSIVRSERYLNLIGLVVSFYSYLSRHRINGVQLNPKVRMKPVIGCCRPAASGAAER
jgi:hypothetical protein